jgi:hypothetical protein
MPDLLDVDTLTAAAAEAAQRNDPAGAAGMLRQVLALQEAALGPHHRDLAATLNNLALMLERQGDLDEAERSYRRACAIAARDAAPDDPLVGVSRANLDDFLRATGRPDSPPPATPPPPPVQAPSPAAALPPRDAAERAASHLASAALHAAPAPTVSASGARRPTNRWWLVPAGLIALGAIGWLATRPATPPEPTTPVAGSPMPQAPPAPAPVSPPPLATPAPPPARAAAPAPPPPTPTRREPDPAPPPAPRAPPRPQSPAEFGRPRTTVTADTSLCAALSRETAQWRCTPLASQRTPAAVYFYTRVRSPQDVAVRHRWTHNGTVVKNVSLRVLANTEPGYRTFSRQVLGASSRGRWEVALLTADGSVVESQRFEVP